MRRAQSVRHYPRPSLALAADDLGVLREGDETNEDVLRRQLLDKDRENDKLQTQIQALQAQLAQRPPIERIQELEKEYKNLDLILQGTQRENERCMAELDRAKAREKMLERELARLAGENWQSALDIPPSSAVATRNIFHHRSATISTSSLTATPAQSIPTDLNAANNTIAAITSSSPTAESQQQQNLLAHVEQVRLLVLGMEQRLQTREEKLTKTIERAEEEGKKFEQARKEVLAT